MSYINNALYFGEVQAVFDENEQLQIIHGAKQIRM